MHFRAIDNAANHFAHVIGGADVLGDQAIEILRIKFGGTRGCDFDINRFSRD